MPETSSGSGGGGNGTAGAAADGSSASPSASAVNRVIAAIAEDPALTRRQKQILREIYESFRAETASVSGAQAGPGAEADAGAVEE
jgi:hypothetical protein